ncbi:MAG: PASTA domain-containing protein [Clostridia bacterium]|nr:PASTA domain-containing protein [Clostridia bacterium]
MDETLITLSAGLCPACFSQLDGSGLCPRCRAATPVPGGAGINEPPCLPARTVVGSRYIIGSAIDRNGDGVTYFAFDAVRRVRCRLREFYPEKTASRRADNTTVEFAPDKAEICEDCRERFVSLWLRLKECASLSSVITVYDLVLDHGTVCAVYEDVPERTLRDYLLGSGAGVLTWERASALFMPVLETLKSLHAAGVIHRGISPSTLLVGSDGRIKLTGFSITQVRTASGELDAELFAGYSAIEQYDPSYRQGPWTDIYAFAAVLYRALTGSQPIDAPTRAVNDKLMIPARFAEQLPAYVINALINALQILPSERTGSVEQFRAELTASPAAVEAMPESITIEPEPPAEDPVKIFRPGSEIVASASVSPETPVAPPAPDPPPPPKNGWKIALAVILAALIVGGVAFAFFWIRSGKAGGDETTTAAETTTVRQTTIPNFVGWEYSALTEQAWPEMLDLQVSTLPSATVKAGVVISQSVPEGTVVDYGTSVFLVVSSGPEKTTMPDVTGMTYNDAESYLTKMNLRVEKSTKYNDGSQIGGTVAETLPAPGEEIEIGQTVTVVVWDEAETTTEPETETTTEAETETETAPVETLAPLTVIDEDDDPETSSAPATEEYEPEDDG